MRQARWYRALRGVLLAVGLFATLRYGGPEPLGFALIGLNIWRLTAPARDHPFGFRHSLVIQLDRLLLAALAAHTLAVLCPSALYNAFRTGVGPGDIAAITLTGVSVIGLVVALWRLSVTTVRASPHAASQEDPHGRPLRLGR